MKNIPNDLLNEFLESKIGYKDFSRITTVKSHFSWSQKNIDRYRINVWTEYLDKGIYKNIIGYSFVVHYNKEEQTLEDMTSGYR